MLIQQTIPLPDFCEVQSKLVMEESRKAHQATIATASPNTGTTATGLTVSTTPPQLLKITIDSIINNQTSALSWVGL